ncbi:hypothetical protein D3C80_2206110 [compost metagenome]
MDITFGEPDFPAGAEIGCHGAERHLAVSEVIQWHNLAELVKHAFPAQQAAALP